ncbi:MAG: prenyltransferase/squalene oxidase repeat-containing protein [Pirellulaceae bacterium]
MEQRNSKSSSPRKPGKPPPGSIPTPQPPPTPSDLDSDELDLGEVDVDDELRLAPLEDSPPVKRAAPVIATPLNTPKINGKAVANNTTSRSAPSRHGASAETAAEVFQPGTNAQEQSTTPRARAWPRWFGGATPSWLVSLLVHVVVILTLAAITLDPIDRVLSILTATTSQTGESIEQFELLGPQLDNPESQVDPLSTPSTEVSQMIEMPELTSVLLPSPAMSVDGLDTNRLTESVMPSALLSGGALSQMTTSLNSRSKASKSEMLERYGGTSESEKAVAMALKWIAEHQALNGGWTFAHSEICHGQCDGAGELSFATNAATAMAILPFLGAGQTHMEGQYKETVHKGLAFLINRMKVTTGQLPEGSWHEPGGTMYSHALASIAVCEAYAMTRDPDLLQPAQLSLNYLIASQDPHGGGWRYAPRQPGDTSVVGWCVMALKSGRMGNLIVPDETFAGAKRFLDTVSTNKGAYYGYDKPAAKINGRRATTAVGLLCRMYMGWPKEHPGIHEGVKYLAKVGPNPDDLYYSYYGTQVMRQYDGPDWEKWNAQLRDDLIDSQVAQGHAAGSWLPTDAHSEKGGRLYSTSLATMILEVYYRHMPLYSQKSAENGFEL